ncbi:Ig-like domain-containing protein [Luedemannella flava]|uniref:Ig-like domain-containing protein n=1 Tax=Luedemannella flava TaxID=349316 RepID=A0ABN2LKN1_9ACTN
MLRSGQVRLRVAAALALTVAVALTGACGSSADAKWHSPGDATASPGATAGPGESALTVTPAANAKNVSPAGPIGAEINGGSLTEVKLTNSSGKAVKGEFDADRRSWQVTEKLGYNKTYTMKVTATGADGKTYDQTTKFTTVKPKNLTLPYLRANYGTMLDGGTFGVGQPITVWFDEPIKDKKAAEESLTVKTDPPVYGVWHWFDNREVHWRPKEYWPAGTKVTVKASVYGKNLGNGLYGQQDVSASFKIGASHIAIADAKTKRMKVYFDGKQVKKINGKDVSAGIPISMGKDQVETGANGEKIDFRTYSGVHVVMLKHNEYRMTSASFGITDKNSPNYYDSLIKKAVRISNSGEFFHLADWNIWAHGKQNTSHGCINIGPSFIYWMFDNFRPGDVIDVKNTGKQLDPRDGLGDWQLSWKKWTDGSALPIPPEPTEGGTEATPTPDPSATP